MKILHVSNLRFNRRWYRWLLDQAPRHDLLVVAGNLVDRADATSLDRQRAWVRDWFADYGRPAAVASGPEDRVFDPQANAWRSARWLQDLGAAVCADDGFVTHDGFTVHSIGDGELPGDRHADIWVSYRDPRRLTGSSAMPRHGGCGGTVALRGDPAAMIVLTGDLRDRPDWQCMTAGTLHLNPGWRPEARFPNHVLLDPETLAACRITETGYFPKVDVFGPVFRPRLAAPDGLLSIA